MVYLIVNKNYLKLILIISLLLSKNINAGKFDCRYQYNIATLAPQSFFSKLKSFFSKFHDKIIQNFEGNNEKEKNTISFLMSNLKNSNGCIQFDLGFFLEDKMIKSKILNAIQSNKLLVFRFESLNQKLINDNNYSKANACNEIDWIFEKFSEFIEINFFDVFWFDLLGKEEEIRELLKNAFVHGNFLKLNEPIFFYMDLILKKISVFNISDSNKKNRPDYIDWKITASSNKLMGTNNNFISVINNSKRLSYIDSYSDGSDLIYVKNVRIFEAEVTYKMKSKPINLKLPLKNKEINSSS